MFDEKSLARNIKRYRQAKGYSQGELAGLLSDFLRTLPEEERMLFMGRYFHALSVAEVARRMGMKANTAAVKLMRIREALRVYLSERGYSV